MTEALNVITICGSLRKGSYNAALARYLPKIAPSGMCIAEGPGIGAIPLYNQDLMDVGVPPAVTEMVDAIRAADGVIMVSPEYNWSIPGPLKNAIDWVSHVKNQPFGGKAISLLSAANGLLGGSRMQYHLRQALVGLDAQVFVRPEIFVTFAHKKFDDKLDLIDQLTIDLLTQHLAGFEKFVRRLRALG